MARRTFAKAREELFDHLRREGWTVHLRDARTFKPLKVPYAIDPRGEHRLYFKAQVVYLGHAGSGASIQQARSVHVDIRDLSPSEFIEHVRRWMQSNGLEPNALLAKPPQRRHQLRSQTHRYFESVVGRRPNSTDYDGVHTTGSLALAAAYAMGTWDQVGGADGDAYPVIIAMDVTGLHPEPDVDAMMSGQQALKDIRGEVADILAGGGTVDDVRWAGEHYEVTRENGPGDDPAAFVFEQIPRDPFRSLTEALERQGMDDERMHLALEQFVKEGPKALPGVVISKIVDQQRYLNDFELDRVVQVIAFRPWWHEVMDTYWDMDDPQEEAKAKSINDGGWKLWTIEDTDQIGPEPSVVLYRRSEAQATKPPLGLRGLDVRREPRIEYHGTVSTAIEGAFPGLIPAKPPFPVDSEG